LTHFLLYWRLDTVENTDSESPQYYAGSEWIGKDGVRRGDTLWVVTSPAQGKLILVARIAVTRVVHSRAKAVRIGDESAWRDAEHFAFDRREDSRPKQEIDITSIARRLTFEGGVQRLPRSFDGKICSGCDD